MSGGLTSKQDVLGSTAHLLSSPVDTSLQPASCSHCSPPSCTLFSAEQKGALVLGLRQNQPVYSNTVVAGPKIWGVGACGWSSANVQLAPVSLSWIWSCCSACLCWISVFFCAAPAGKDRCLVTQVWIAFATQVLISLSSGHGQGHGK